MLCRYFIKVKELLACTAPRSDYRRIFVKIGFIPDLPILDIIFKSVCPTIVIVTDYMFAYNSPFLKILWGIREVLFYVVLYFLTETVKGLRACKKRYRNVFVSTSEIVGLLFVRIGKNSLCEKSRCIFLLVLRRRAFG